MKLTDNYTGPGGQWLDRYWKQVAVLLGVGLVVEFVLIFCVKL